MIKTTLNGSNLPVLQSQLLLNEAGIVHFSTLRGDYAPNDPYSEFNLCDYTGDNWEHVHKSRSLFADALGITIDRMWFPRQVHGTNIVEVNENSHDTVEADAVITQTKGLLIGVSTADCVPILLYDKCIGIVAAVHAGWRGTVARIVEKTVARLTEQFGSDPINIICMIGPSISPGAYEVGEEVVEIFENEGFADCVVGGYRKPHVDLWQANLVQIQNMGIPRENIDCTPLCTLNNDFLFSARRSGINSGRILNAIMIK